MNLPGTKEITSSAFLLKESLRKRKEIVLLKGMEGTQKGTKEVKVK